MKLFYPLFVLRNNKTYVYSILDLHKAVHVLFCFKTISNQPGFLKIQFSLVK